MTTNTTKGAEIAPATPVNLPATFTAEALAPRDVIVQSTQLRRPWRATARTLFAGLVALAAMLPALVGASGVDETLPPVAGALAIAGGITRIMAVPAVEGFLQKFVPFLAAAPKP